MATSERVQASGRPPDLVDYDSDVMADSSSDEGDCSVDRNSRPCSTAEEDDDEEYGNFLRSVFCDDDGANGAFQFSDEEDEEEYRPQCADSSDDDDDDDDDDDAENDGLIKMARKELVDLVDGCWQTIAGEPVQFAPLPSEGLVSQKGRGVKRNRSVYFADHNAIIGGVSAGKNLDANFLPPGILIGESCRPSKLPSPHRRENFSSHAATSTACNPKPKGPGQHSASQSLISNLVRQIFSGEKPSAVCLDGMPVDAIRKLVARQMSMASQLLVQMLLTAQDRSTCFSTCYTSLMELSNCRESALKKAALLQMNMRNLRVAALQKAPVINQIGGMNGMRSGVNHNGDEAESNAREMRLTRAVAGRQSKAQGCSGRSTSLFDLPMLSDITELFGAIDLSRKEIKSKIAVLVSSASVSFNPCVSHPSTAAAADPLQRSICYTLNAVGSQMRLLTTYPSTSATSSNIVSALTKIRLWECLIPAPYPSIGDGGSDPQSLIGRSLFTPAEDDLLLRGIVKYGEDSWQRIRQQYLPSKEEQLLQFRFRQMTSPAAKEASKFKRYTALQKNCTNRHEWSHEEDLDLLRGYQIYGDKWPLISIFFFPHRCRKELKARWQTIQDHWKRAFSGNLALINFQTELPPPSKMLLYFLKESSSNTSSTGSPSKSPNRSSQIAYDSSGSIVPRILSMSDHGAGNNEGRNSSRSHGTISDKDARSYTPSNRDLVDHSAVDEDVLADSDEEMVEKDLDWHLGRLTSRQSVLSQWSQTLSSTAAQYSSKNKKVASNSLPQRVESSRDHSVPAADHEKQRLPPADAIQPQVQTQPLHKSDRRGSHRKPDEQRQGVVKGRPRSTSSSSSSSSRSSSGIVDKSCHRNGVRNSSYIDHHPAQSDDSSPPTAEEESISEAPIVASEVLNRSALLTTSSTYSAYAENEFSFCNFSNMTNMLESAKVILNSNNRNVDAQYDSTLPSHSLELHGGVMGSAGGVSSHLPLDDGAGRAEAGTGSSKSLSKGLFAVIMQDSHVASVPGTSSHSSNSTIK